MKIFGRRHNSEYLYRFLVERSSNPQMFRQFMATHWIYAILISGAACGFYVATKPDKENVIPSSEGT